MLLLWRIARMSYEKVAEAKNSLVIGAKQVQKAMRDGEVQEVVVAENAERRVTDHILLTAVQNECTRCVCSTR